MQKLIGVLLLACCVQAGAQTANPYVPPALEDWRGWVLHGQEWRVCPMVFDGPAANRDARFCAWPGVLELTVTNSGAEFRQTWTVGGDITAVPLPGGEDTNWPEEVTVDGGPALVLSSNDRPFVEVSPGTYTITGAFRWESRPGELEISARIGLIDLRVDGERVLVPEIEDDLLFLGKRQSTEVARDEIRTSVYRLAVDSSPSRLTTVLRINVSGGLREATFGPFLPEGFVPERLDSQLPARFEANGQLRVQVRPGEWTVRLNARASGVVDSFAPLVGGENMPDVEILSYQANPGLRVTVPSGLVPVDPGQANVPPEWRSFPAFRASAGDALSLEERSRGIVDSQNELGISRRLWLDFDGSGMTAVDSITGTMRRDWRLDMQSPFLLESAKVNGEDVLVTAGANDQRGVEVRQEQLALRSVSRTDEVVVIPVSGWASQFTGASVELNLPPGRRLLAAPGADNAVGAWFGRWELLDIFLLLVVTAASWRLFGPLVGGIAFAALTLSFHEFGAPAWLWLNLLATVALLRVAPAGRLRSWLRAYYYLGLVVLGLVLLPFVADQFRFALYPQLERSTSAGPAQVRRPDVAQFDPESPLPAARSVSSMAADEAREVLEEVVVAGSRLEVQAPPPKRFERYAPNALVQAGPGVPAWQWQRYTLIWDGPVEAGQTVRLVIAPSWLMSMWRIATALLTALLAAWFIAEALRRQWTLPGGLRIGSAPALVVLALTVLSVGAPGAAHANEIPDRQLLEELRQRLTEAPECVPRCAEFVAARVTIDPRSLEIELDVHASVPVAIPVPGFEGDWRPERVLLNGDVVSGINRADDTLMLAVPAGQHRVTLAGVLEDKSSIEVPFPETPRVIDVQSRGWSVNGVIERRLVTGSLQFDRVREATAGAEEPLAWESSRFPTFVSIVRRLELGLEWRVVTTVQRIAPATGALELGIPLIEGESVITEGIDVEGDVARITMSPNVSRVVWVSSLEAQFETRLTAGDGSRWVDTWEIAAGSIWHVEVAGVPESVNRLEVPGARVARYDPRPGETLMITAARPAAVAGATTAIDSVNLDATVGRRLVETSFDFRYRATRGGQQAISLPAGAELTNIMIDDRIEPLRPVDDVLTIPIRPGSHDVLIRFRQARDHGIVSSAPVVGLGAPASNVNVTLNVANDRWLLLTRGPTLGPAVLYWPQLVVLIGLALILGRIPWTPLKARHWLLLALGFSMFNWPVLALVVAWLLVTGARHRWPLELDRHRYNGVQALHAMLTVFALAAIVVSLPFGLLGAPDMHVVGNGSWSYGLNWFADQTSGETPSASFLSLPLWAYKALILVWALWLTFALLAWLPWVWRVWVKGGLWRAREYDELTTEAGRE